MKKKQIGLFLIFFYIASIIFPSIKKKINFSHFVTNNKMRIFLKIKMLLNINIKFNFRANFNRILMDIHLAKQSKFMQIFVGDSQIQK